MPRYIDADDVLEAMRSNMDMQELYLPIHFIDLVIDEMPTADVEPVRHGHWKRRDALSFWYECNLCDWVIDQPTNFCPHCGAKMDG